MTYLLAGREGWPDLGACACFRAGTAMLLSDCLQLLGGDSHCCALCSHLLTELVSYLQNSGIVLPSMGEQSRSSECGVIVALAQCLQNKAQAETDAPLLCRVQVTRPRQIPKRHLMMRWRSQRLTNTR